tara:strand:- start:10993 stop:12174 length:1182 start_codon:yes stop_codon:yes gene_type:complete
MDNRLLPIETLSGCKAFGTGVTLLKVNQVIKKLSHLINDLTFLLVLAGSRTAEVEGISWAGLSVESRRYTSIADAELLLKGPLASRYWPLPPLPGGVSPSLISYVANNFLGLEPIVINAGLIHTPPFPHLLIEDPSIGPSNCISTGNAMSFSRVEVLWNAGLEMGLRLNQPILLTECVPGGTTTAQAVLSGLGLEVTNLISGSVLNPPKSLKKNLVKKGLSAACLGPNPSSKELLSAVGDPFQVFTVGLLIGARRVGQTVILGGGSQMLAVLAMALLEVNADLRSDFVEDIAIMTTSWLVEESNPLSEQRSSFVDLMEIIADYFHVSLMGFASGLRFHGSARKLLRDYEIGYVKEGVGAGALSFLAQLKGISLDELVNSCELAVDQLPFKNET